MPTMYRTREELADLKRECWRSPWRAIKRKDGGLPTRYVLLSAPEMHYLATTGRLQLPEPAARRLGVFPEPEEITFDAVPDENGDFSMEILVDVIDGVAHQRTDIVGGVVTPRKDV